MALATDLAVTDSFIKAHQATGHRFEVDAEACLPTIRCWDFGTVEIVAQSMDEIEVAAGLAAEESADSVTVHVPSPLVGMARAALRSQGQALRVQAFGADAGQLQIGHPERG